MRSSRYEPIVDKVELIYATQSYTPVRLSSGRKATVSFCDVALISHKSELYRNFSETDDEFEHEFLFNRSDASNTVSRNVITLTLPETQKTTNSNDICNNSSAIDEATAASLQTLELTRFTRVRRHSEHFAYPSDYIK